MVHDFHTKSVYFFLLIFYETTDFDLVNLRNEQELSLQLKLNRSNDLKNFSIHHQRILVLNKIQNLNHQYENNFK